MDISTVASKQTMGPAIGKSFGIRTGAYVIDVVVIILTNYAVTFAIGVLVGIGFYLINGRVAAVVQDLSTQFISWIVAIVLNILYFVVFERVYGATLGKVILGMRVINEDGTPCSFKAAFIRGLARYVDSFFFAIPAYTTMHPPLHQRYGDRWARTVVMSPKETGIRSTRAWWWFLLAAGIYLILNSISALISLITMIR